LPARRRGAAASVAADLTQRLADLGDRFGKAHVGHVKRPAHFYRLLRQACRYRIQLRGPVTAAADITPAAAAYLHLEPGRQLWAAVKATETRTYLRESSG
jgi:TOBE domain